MVDEPNYLGDGLYVSDDGYQVELFAHNGFTKTNRVFLDQKVLEHFVKWVKQSKFAYVLND